MNFLRVKSLWYEKKGFYIERLDTGDEYIFAHYLTPVTVLEDGKMINVRAGSCHIYNKHSHQIFRSDDSELCHDWFHLAGNIDKLMEKYGLQYNKIYSLKNSETITNIIQSIEFEHMAMKKFSNEICRLKLEELLAKIARGAFEKEDYIPNEVWNSVIGLRSDIQIAYNQPWNVEKMAKKINMSSSYFYKIYKQIFGVPPQKDLQETRIEHAKLLLVEGKCSVKQISELIGYTNEYHFIRQFKQLTGVTPGKYLSKF